MTAATPRQELTPKQRRYVRSLGHHLKPKATVGREGLTDQVIKAIDAVLAANELVKVNLGKGCELDRHDAAPLIADATGAVVAQVIGRVILLFRANPKLKADKRLSLPE